MQHQPGEHRWRGHAAGRQARELDKLKAVVGEAGRPGFHSAPLADIGICGPGLAEVFSHQPPVGMEHFAMPQHDLGTRRRLHSQPDEPGEVLPHVEDENPRLQFAHAPRGQLLRDANRLGRIAVEHRRPNESQLAFRAAPRFMEGCPHARIGLGGHRLHPRPLRRHKVCGVPAWHLPPGVMFFPHQKISLAHRPFPGDLPGGVGHDALPRAIGIFDLKLAEKRRRFAVDVPPRLVRPIAHQQRVAEIPGIPAVGHHRPEAVAAILCQQRCHIMRANMHPLLVVGPPRLKQAVADTATIERPFDKPQCRAVQNRPAHRLTRAERLAVVMGRRQMELLRRVMQRALVTRGDPVGFPIGGVEHTHRPTGRLAPL